MRDTKNLLGGTVRGISLAVSSRPVELRSTDSPFDCAQGRLGGCPYILVTKGGSAVHPFQI
jgi:hypothetical protein